LHLGSAFILFQDDSAQYPGICQANERDSHHTPNGNLLEAIKAMSSQIKDIHEILQQLGLKKKIPQAALIRKLHKNGALFNFILIFA
jgi:hypothetical protein